MRYDVNGSECQLPLTVESVKRAVDYINSGACGSEPEYEIICILRDVLKCVVLNASHAKELAEEALKINEYDINK